MEFRQQRQRLKQQRADKLRSQSCPHLVKPRLAVSSQPVVSFHTTERSLDPCDRIMDHIDAEMNQLAGPMPLSSPKAKKKRPSKSERARLQDQGVEFDTGDETGGEVKRPYPVKLGVEKERSTDTGVGSGAEDFCSSAENTPRQPLSGFQHQYSDDEKENKKDIDGLSDLDSDTAHQVEEKYLHILNKKRGGYLRDLCMPSKRPSDLESVRTEDFEDKFRECMLPLAGKGTGVRETRMDPRPSPIKEVDLESVRTEDIASEFMKTIPKLDTGRSEVMYGTRRSAHSPSKPMRARHGAFQSDAESVVTEDYENQYHHMLIKQVAKTPITHLDQMLIDSDLDTVKSQLIQDRINSITQNDYPDSINSSEVDEAKVEAMIERKLQQFFSKRGARDSGLSTPTAQSPSRSAKKMHGLYLDTDDDDDDTPSVLQRTASPVAQRPGSPALHRTASPARSTGRYSNAEMVEQADDSGLVSMAPHHGSPSRSKHSGASLVGSPNNSYIADSSRNALRELKSLHDVLRQNKEDIRQTERQIKENRMKAEEARTQLMLAEFKRDSAAKELEHLAAEVSRRREELTELDDKLDAAADKQQQEAASNKEEISRLTAERDELRATLRSKEPLAMEKAELERQLAATKENFLAEQKKHRTRIEEVTEELEARQHRIDELLGERDGLEKQLKKHEAKSRQTETEKNELIKEKTREYQGLAQRLQQEMQETRTTASREQTELRQQLKELSDQLAATQAKVNKAEEDCMTLRDEKLELQKEAAKQSEKMESMKDEYQKNIQGLLAEKESALNNLRAAVEEDRQTSLDQLKEELQQRHQTQLAEVRAAAAAEQQAVLEQAQSAMQQELVQLQSVLSAKELEVEVLKDRIQQQEENSRTLSERLKQDTMDQVRNALRSEREQWQRDKEAELKQQLDSQRAELERSLIHLKDELDTERHICEQQLQQITTLKQELEEARHQQREAYQERMAALSQTKELAQEEKERELAMLRTKIQQEAQRETARLQDNMARLEADMKRLQTEKAELTQREKESVTMLERQEKTLVYQVNDECRKIANLLGISARIVNVTGYGSIGASVTTPAWSKSQLLAATTSALGNLRSCTEELRHHVEHLKRECAGSKQQLRQAENKKREEMEALREKMQQEKMRAMEQLKERLIQEHIQEIDKLRDSLGRGKSAHKALREKDRELKEIQANMKTWKDDTLQKMSKKFQDELARELDKRNKDFKKQKREWERQNQTQQRDIERLRSEVTKSHLSSSMPIVSSVRAASPVGRRPATPILSQSYCEAEKPSDTVRLLNHLQGKVKQLTTENVSLKRGTSTPNLADNTLGTTDAAWPDDRQVRLLQQQIETANTKAKLAESRAESNEKMLNQKMVELSKIQGTLTQQTKELMQLERAYSQLQNHATRLASRSPTR